MKELLPCPFCGGEAVYIQIGGEDNGIHQTRVRCTVCDASQDHRWRTQKFDFDFIREETVKSWNRRVV